MASKQIKLAAITAMPRHLQCCACGFDAEQGAKKDDRCPKCGSSSWEIVPVDECEWIADHQSASDEG